MLQRKKTSVFLVFLLFLATTLGGCVWADSDVDHVRISPNGRTVVFIATDTTYAGLTELGPGSGLHSMYIRWSGVESVNVQKSVRIAAGSWDMRYGLMGTGNLVEEVKFSPNSRHVAILAPRRIWILQPATGKHWVLQTKDVPIKSMAWISNDELAYCKITHTGKKERMIFHLRVYRQKITQPASDRVEVYRQDGKNASPSFSWSPSGRYVVLGPSPWGQCSLLDIQTRKVLDFGPENASLCYQGIAWKTDESAVFCALERFNVTEKVGMPIGNDFFLIYPAGERIENITRPDQKIEALYLPSFAPLWTADNRYVVKNAGWVACSLIQPRPWRVIPLKDKIIKRLKITRQDDLSWPELHPLPVPGWLWTRDSDSKIYAMDYEARRFVPIAESWRWSVSSDGKYIAEVNKKGKVTIRTLKLPPLPTTQPTSDRTDK